MESHTMAEPRWDSARTTGTPNQLDRDGYAHTYPGAEVIWPIPPTLFPRQVCIRTRLTRAWATRSGISYSWNRTIYRPHDPAKVDRSQHRTTWARCRGVEGGWDGCHHQTSAMIPLRGSQHKDNDHNFLHSITMPRQDLTTMIGTIPPNTSHLSNRTCMAHHAIHNKYPRRPQVYGTSKDTTQRMAWSRYTVGDHLVGSRPLESGPLLSLL